MANPGEHAMDQLPLMALSDLEKTDAHKAFEANKSVKLPPEQSLMNMMWHSAKALKNRLFIPRLVFKESVLIDETTRNPEFHAALICATSILNHTKEQSIDINKKVVSRKGELMSIQLYTDKINKKYPELGEFYTTLFANYNLPEIAQQIKTEDISETSKEISAPDPKLKEKPEEIKTVFSQNVIANPTSISAQLSDDLWETVNAKTGRVGFD
jgi:hypothetical protein